MDEEIDQFIEALLLQEHRRKTVKFSSQKFLATYKGRSKEIAKLFKISFGKATITIWKEDNRLDYRFKDCYDEKHTQYQAEVKRLTEEMRLEHEAEMLEWRPAHEGQEAKFERIIGNLGSVYLQAFLNGSPEPILYGNEPDEFIITNEKIREKQLNQILKDGIEMLKVQIKAGSVKNLILRQNLLVRSKGFEGSESIDVEVIADDQLIENFKSPIKKVLEQIKT